MEDVEVKTETENQQTKDSQNEHARGILDYDEGFKPEYRNKVKTVEVTPVADIPDEDDIVAQNDENYVQKAGEPGEQEVVKTESEVKSYTKPTDDMVKNGDFMILMQSDIWNQVINVVKTLVGEVKFQFVEEGITTIVVDPAHVAMMDITIPRDDLQERVGEIGTVFTLDTERLPKFRNGCVIGLSRKKDAGVKFLYDGIEQTIAELDDDSVTVPRIPQLSYDGDSVSATMRVEQLKKYFPLAGSVSDAVKITAHREGMVILSSKNDDKSKTELILDREEHGGLLDIHMNYGTPAISSIYPMEYIHKTLKAIPSVSEITISFKTDYPMAAMFKLPWSVKKNSNKQYLPGVVPVKFYLAPRMEQ